ncbi:DUF962 domain-containing protein [Aliiroseovarius lamellibrachiae]|uniref:Mpo1 family 2-hydroxy fatty acid dioxygenase n=1 Tax=Aliiroseovarius lamellibrachiae TaxID=1924933 RepID=UPI001BE103F5|nr:Mpo1-like protein [Aliiroseovarius lamellibrachiae]MBT2132200.1 DUF962 domain-containing protein [Aliiroseovarius lamellibrachiae]
MARIEALLEEYGESHQNPTNKLVHWICVPVIFWTVMAFLYALPAPAILGQGAWLLIATLGAGAYYLFQSPRLTIGVMGFVVLCFWSVIWVDRVSPSPLWQVAVALFVIAWIGQFWGHKVEGKKPSFFKDVQFLLIGPAWLMSFIYRKLGLPI